MPANLPPPPPAQVSNVQIWGQCAVPGWHLRPMPVYEAGNFNVSRSPLHSGTFDILDLLALICRMLETEFGADSNKS